MNSGLDLQSSLMSVWNQWPEAHAHIHSVSPDSAVHIASAAMSFYLRTDLPYHTCLWDKVVQLGEVFQKKVQPNAVSKPGVTF